ncbi:MAG: intradiol ring-cleavage dioxygenase, partial [Acidimicrobiales bacterium]|nr:intradiol ring-cleavage dioxygenase [Acidimicrobiales bacterium]
MTRPRPTRPTGSAGSAVEDHDDFGGLHRDTSHQYDRRRALQLMVGVGVAGLVSACSSGSGGQAAVTTTTASVAAGGPSPTGGSAGSGAGAAIPDETAGPFPADGSNGPNVLTDGAVVRTDLTTSFGDHRGTAEGVPLTVQLTVVDAATGQPRSGAAVYLWHCTADGRYSLYEVEDQNYLRGVQVADDAGRISFTTVYPGCYSGRWPHCH